MTLEQQGAYRNLLDEAALRGGALPADDRVLAKASGDAVIWPKVRAKVMGRFQKHPDGCWHNETLDKVLKETTLRADRQRRWRNGGRNARRNEGHSPDPDQDQESKCSARRAPILTALTHEVLNVGTFDSISDLVDTVKTKAAQLKIPYDGDAVAKAIRSVNARRAITTT